MDRSDEPREAQVGVLNVVLMISVDLLGHDKTRWAVSGFYPTAWIQLWGSTQLVHRAASGFYSAALICWTASGFYPADPSDGFGVLLGRPMSKSNWTVSGFYPTVKIPA